jgi:hypothetical protein
MLKIKEKLIKLILFKINYINLIKFQKITEGIISWVIIYVGKFISKSNIWKSVKYY